MFRAFYELDRILRGDATSPERIRDGNLQIPLRGIFASVIILGALSGLCVGTFAFFRGIEKEMLSETWKQTVASMCKVPALYVLTLMVTFPSLYVFNALVGSRLSVTGALKLLVAALGVNMAVLASLGPILAFFSASTPNYSFIVLLNVVVFATSGILGLAFLAQTLSRLVKVRPAAEFESMEANDTGIASGNAPGSQPLDAINAELLPVSQVPPLPVRKANSLPTGPLDRLDGEVLSRRAIRVFTCWIIVFGLVGAQMSWILRPFIGSPGQPFTIFRPRESNFFESAWRTFINVFF